MTSVLIVDDEPNNRTIIELFLEDFDDVEISHAENGSEAIRMCQEHHYDIIFMDVMMPETDGITATRTIKSFDKKTMILALSALDDEESKNAMLAAGAEDYMTKPIVDTLFHRRFRNYLEIVTLRNQKPSHACAINLFTKEIYARSLKFTITTPHSLAEMWDYYLNDGTHYIENLEECVRILYAYGQFSLKHGHAVSIFAEENDENLYLTLSPLESVRETVIQQTLLRHYKNAIFIYRDGKLSFRLPKIGPAAAKSVETLEISDTTQAILSKTHFNKLSAAEYVDQTAISLINKVENLERTKEELESAALGFENSPAKERLEPVIEHLDTYIGVINDLMQFEHLAYALLNLNDFLRSLDPASLDPKDLKKFSLLFMSLLDDLEGWRNNIFVLKEANDIHYLDSSLLSSCLQLQSLLTQKEVSQVDEDGFELF